MDDVQLTARHEVVKEEGQQLMRLKQDRNTSVNTNNLAIFPYNMMETQVE